MKVRKTVKKLINVLGYDIHKIIDTPQKIRHSMADAYQHIQSLGFMPKTVIDVGVATGTPELYSVFPNSRYLLIEPLERFEPDLKAILKKHEGSYVIAAAGKTPGQVTFNLHQDNPDGSSLYKETMGAKADGDEISVRMIAIDNVVKEKGLAGPFLIKVDVQGAEIDALEGAGLTLSETEVVALEVSLFEFMKGAPQFYDVIAYMKKHSFVAYDIIPGWNRPLDDALGQVDIVFVKEDGMFRRDHSYSK